LASSCVLFTFIENKGAYSGENTSHICVVIPFYNRVKTIADTLTSLVHQTYKNFEVIIVDDGSEIEAQEELDKIVSSYRTLNIKVVHQENKHLSAARNTGARNCDGEWIMFLDDDDISKPNHLQDYLKAAINIGAEALTNNVDIFKGDKPSEEYEERWVGIGPSIEVAFYRNGLGATANIFIKKIVFDEVGGFNEKARGFEDWEFGVRLLLAKKKLEVVPESLYWYRDTPGSMMKSLNQYESNMLVLNQFLDSVSPEMRPILLLARSLNDKSMKDSWWQFDTYYNKWF